MSKKSLNPEEYGRQSHPDKGYFPSNEQENLQSNRSPSVLNSQQDNQSLFQSVKTGTQWDPQIDFDSLSQFTNFLNQEQCSNGNVPTSEIPSLVPDSAQPKVSQENKFPWIGMENCSMMPGIQNPSYPVGILDEMESAFKNIANEPTTLDSKPLSNSSNHGDEVVYDLTNYKSQKNNSELLSPSQRGQSGSTEATQNPPKSQPSNADSEDQNEVVLYSKPLRTNFQPANQRTNFQPANQKNDLLKNFQKELQSQMRIYAGKREKTWNEVYHNSVPGSPNPSIIEYDPTKKIKTYSTCMPNSPRSEMFGEEQTSLPAYNFKDGPVSGINSVYVSGASAFSEQGWFNPNSRNTQPSWMKAFIANDKTMSYQQNTMPTNSDQPRGVQNPRYLAPHTELRILEHVYPLTSARKDKHSNESYHIFGIMKYKSITRITYHTPEGIQNVELLNKKSNVQRKKITYTPCTDLNFPCSFDNTYRNLKEDLQPFWFFNLVEKFPQDYKKYSHVKSAKYMMEWLDHMGDAASHELSRHIKKYMAELNEKESTSPEFPLRQEKVYYRKISDKTRAWVNKQAWLTRISYKDTQTKSVTWFGFKISEKLYALQDPKKNNLDSLLGSPQASTFNNFIDMHLDLLNKKKLDDYPQYMPPNAEFDDIPDTITDKACCGKQTKDKQIFLRFKEEWTENNQYFFEHIWIVDFLAS